VPEGVAKEEAGARGRCRRGGAEARGSRRPDRRSLVREEKSACVVRGQLVLNSTWTVVINYYTVSLSL
jgi:hypothetical protein